MAEFKKNKKGFTIIEVLIDLFLLATVSMAIAGAFTASFKSMVYAKSKLAAVGLVNEKIEKIRNMPYDDLATEHGLILPHGNILDNESVVRNGSSLNVKTDIQYVDDPFDGNFAGTITGKPKDLYPYDYKKVEITVRRQGTTGNRGILASITSNVAAKAAETPSNTGIIYLCIIDSNKNPVLGAHVEISNSDLGPDYDIRADTGNDGCIMVPNLPPNQHNNYHVAATKEGYSSDQTYPRTAQNPKAEQPDLDVFAQRVTSATLTIDRVSTMEIDFVDSGGVPIENAPVHIEGNELKYNNPDTKIFSQDFTSDVSGHLSVSNLRFDDYLIQLSGWNIVSMSPFSPVDLKAGVTLNVKVVASHNAGTMRVYTLNPSIGLLNQTADITLTGDNFSAPTLKLVRGTVEINATNIQVNNNQTVTVEFDLQGAALGMYDIVIQQGGENVHQTDAFEVINQ